MKSVGKWLATSSALALLALATPAQAYVIGIAVGGNGQSTRVGLTPAAAGTISFYALLNDSGTYGVGGSSTNGMVADTCSTSSTSNPCSGGTLNMWLRFAPVTLGANVLALAFEDLDLRGVNDPIHFLESITVYDYSGSVRRTVAYDVDDSEDDGVTANRDDQLIELDVDVDNNPYYVRLVFNTEFRSNTPSGTHTNTVERLRATITSVSVPEPATLSMLGAGLLLMGFATRRRPKHS